MRKSYFFTGLLALSMSGLLNDVRADETDVTTFILNPSFEHGTDGWTVSNLNRADNGNFSRVAGKYFLEKWTSSGSVGSAAVQQTLSNLPAGNYVLTAAAQNIQQSSAVDQTGASVYVGSTNTTVKAAADYAVSFSTPGTDVKIGFKAVNATGNWICVDNFRLTYVSPDLTLLQTAVTNAEATIATSEKASYAGLQPTIKFNLENAIAAAKEATETTTAETLQGYAFELAERHGIAKDNMDALKSLKTLVTKSKSLLTKDMAAVYRASLQDAYDDAVELLKLESDENVYLIMNRLQLQYDEADASNKAWKALNSSITTANTQLNKESATKGKAELQEAITLAVSIRDNENATPDEMSAAKEGLDNAVLYNRIQNATGTPLTVKTLSAVQGATEIFGRASFSGTTAKEKGFCWSEEPYPTIFDNRSTTVYDNNGDIYAMQELDPATVYYVRAYAISSGYQLSYGDVLKVPTRPLGNVRFSYGNEGDEATNKRIYAACEDAVWMWNNIGGIQDFFLSAHYKYGAGAGSGTAECSYGGYMSVSQNEGCQRTGTILHEGAHGLGMVPYTDWTNSIYRTNGDRGDWLGPRVDRVIQFLDNNPSAKLHGDNQHMWPYGINGAGEDSGSPILYRANALLVEALSEDGITHSGQAFLTPGYSFAQDDETKYYIKNEATARGLATSYLRQKTATNIRFEEMKADEAFANDSCAWYIKFNPATCYYTFINVATGKYLSMSSGSATAASSASNASFQLLGSRNKTTYEDFTFAGTSFWAVTANGHNALNATATGASSASFNHADASTTQRWLFLTADEVSRFAQAQGETVGISKPKAVSHADIQVMGGKGVIGITAAGEGQDVQIFAADGRLIRHLYVQRDANAQVAVTRGIYIVNGKKVLVR